MWFEHRSCPAFEPQFTPSCSFPVRVRGQATPERAGLVRCYLQALARGDTTGLNALATPPADESTGLVNMVMGGSSVWRMSIG